MIIIAMEITIIMSSMVKKYQFFVVVVVVIILSFLCRIVLNIIYINIKKTVRNSRI